MKNFELENAELKSMSNDEMQKIEGGNDWVTAIKDEWVAFKKGCVDAYNEYKAF